MWKAIVAGTAVLAIAGTSLVYAQHRGGQDGASGGSRARRICAHSARRGWRRSRRAWC